MTVNTREKVRRVLDCYLESNQHRKTPERYAILDAVYSMRGHFTLEELDDLLAKKNFRVSKSTLYNTMHLFIELRLVVRHGLADGTKYEACYCNGNHVHLVCTLCGKVKETRSPVITQVIDNADWAQFTQDAFALYVYGVCDECRGKAQGQ